jgi:hypothetical protein
MKRPGSRRAAVESKRSPQWENHALDQARQEVGIDFVCRRKHPAEILAQFRMSTADGSEHAITVEVLQGGRLPEESGRPDGEAKALMVCPKCHHNKQVSEAALRAFLDAIWEPRRAIVQTYEV